MAIPYQTIARHVALRSKQIEDGDAGAREAAYTQSDIASSMDGVEVPPTSLKEAILAQERELVQMIGAYTNPVWKSLFADTSDPVASGGVVPFMGTNGGVFLGALDGVFDQSDNLPLTEQPLAVVLEASANAGGFFQREYYHYHIAGSLLYHTRSGACVRGVAYDQTTAEARYDSQGNSALPAEFEMLWAARVLATLAQEGWFQDEALLYQRLAQEKEIELFGSDAKSDLMRMPALSGAVARVNPLAD